MAVQNQVRKNYQVIENSIQTNGILLNDQWCQFLSQNNFLVGKSVDGLEVIHNVYRRDYAGNGTFDKVMQAIALMNEHALQCNILTLVTDANIAKAHDFLCILPPE